MTTYVNQGPDPRIGGALGEGLARLQRRLSFRSASPPKVLSVPLKAGGHVAIAWPPFFSIFVSKGDGTYRSFRIGWRWDALWGDGNNPTEMQVAQPGGFIADVIVKSSIDHVVRP